MKPANITKNQDGPPDLFINLHKLLGTEVALDIYLSNIGETVDILPFAALQAECMEHKVRLQVIINTLAEFLNNTTISIKVATAFTNGTDVIDEVQHHFKQSTVVAILTQCHVAVIYVIKTDCLALSHPTEIHPFLLQTLSSHERMERELQKFA